MKINSNRQFKIVILDVYINSSIEQNNKVYCTKEYLEEILRGDYEYNYTLQDILDTVLDLKVNESMYFQPNRDNPNSKGIILRIK